MRRVWTLSPPTWALIFCTRLLYLSSARRGSRLQAVPPRTDAGHHFVIAVYHLHRAAETILGIFQTQRARLGAVCFGQPDPFVAPHARAFLAFGSLPRVDVDRTRAPAVFDHEGGWRPRIERGDEIAGVAAKRHADAVFFPERKIVSLSDVIERIELHHDVMDGVLAGLDESEAVVPRIEMQEPGDKWMVVIVGQAETEDAAVEFHQLV